MNNQQSGAGVEVLENKHYMAARLVIITSHMIVLVS